MELVSHIINSVLYHMIPDWFVQKHVILLYKTVRWSIQWAILIAGDRNKPNCKFMTFQLYKNSWSTSLFEPFLMSKQGKYYDP